MDITRAEQVESDLNSLITKRHERRVVEEGERPALEMWQESERKHAAERQKQLAFDWIQYHEERLAGQRRIFSLLATHHRSEIQRYQKLLGKKTLEGSESGAEAKTQVLEKGTA